MIPNEEVIYVYVEVVKLPQDIITYKVNKTNLNMQVGEQFQLKVTETTLTPQGQTSKKDVTASTTFKVVNNTIARVQKGLSHSECGRYNTSTCYDPKSGSNPCIPCCERKRNHLFSR